MATLILLAVLASIMAVTATISWSGGFTWTWTPAPTYEFSVWDSEFDGALIPTPFSENLGTVDELGTTVFTRQFWLQNDADGTTVYVHVTTEDGCTGEWNGASWVLPYETTRVLAQLELNITGDGSYDFTFELTPPP